MLVFNGCHQIDVGIGESSRVSPANGFGGHGLRAGEEQRAGRNVYCGYIGVVDGFGKVSQSVSVSNIRGVPSRPTLHVRPVSATATPRAPAPRRRTPPRAARAAITAVSEPRAQWRVFLPSAVKAFFGERKVIIIINIIIIQQHSQGN